MKGFRLATPGRITGRYWGTITFTTSQLILNVAHNTASLLSPFRSTSVVVMVYRLAPNIQNAFEELDKAVAEARENIKERLANKSERKLASASKTTLIENFFEEWLESLLSVIASAE